MEPREEFTADQAERDYWDAHYLYCDPEEGCYC